MRLSNAAASPTSSSFVPLYPPSFSYRVRSVLRSMTGRGKSSCAGVFDGEIKSEFGTAAREVVETAREPMTQPAPVQDVHSEALQIVAEEAPVSREDETPAPQVASQLQRPSAPVPNRIPARATRERTPALAAQRRRRTSAAARTNKAVEKTARPVHLDR